MPKSYSRRKDFQMTKFFKYQGLGNDFIVFDFLDEAGHQQLLRKIRLFSKTLCDRSISIGADGIVLLLPSTQNKLVRMVILNSDGSEAEMCGNGIRCLVKYLKDLERIQPNNEYEIETKAGLIKAAIDSDGLISIDMGKPIFAPSLIPTNFTDFTNNISRGLISYKNLNLNVYTVSMGNPHAIIFTKEHPDLPLLEIGPYIETNSHFPLKTNVHLVDVIDQSTVSVKVWERGCGATQACGTGACAVVVVSKALGLCKHEVSVNLPGGTLYIDWPGENSSVFMKGPALRSFLGDVTLTNMK